MSKTRTIHIPRPNTISGSRFGKLAFEWYGRRAKFFAAFQRFVFQSAELRNLQSVSEVEIMARNFAAKLTAYDFWDDTPMWGVISTYGAAIRHFLRTGNSGLGRSHSRATTYTDKVDTETAEWMRMTDILRLWDLLALLPRCYEDVCREWFLPTALGYLSSYRLIRPSDAIIRNTSVPLY